MNARLFEELRPVGFAVAYRMLGSVSEAEDIVQEAFIRLDRVLDEGGERIESPRAYLATVVTRLCIDHLRSARARRETYVEALPEPLVGEPGAAVHLVAGSGPAGVAGDDPAGRAEMADSLSLAFLVLLESLSPEQRAAFLLREVFDYPYDRIAAIVGSTEDNARQLVTRARRHVEQRRPRFESSHERRDRLAQRFFAAAEHGDFGALEELLAHDVSLHGDGGGLPRPVTGRVRVARTLRAGMRLATTRLGDISLREVSVNGQPGAMVLDASDRLIAVLALDITAGGQIQTVTSMANPEKLRHLGPLADPDLFRRARRGDREGEGPASAPG